MWVHTFHALGVRLLREFGSLVGVAPGFSIYDEADRLRVVKEAMEACGTREVLLRPEAVQAAISNAKNKLQSPAQFADLADTFEQRVVARVYETYEALLRQRNGVDFDDLLMRVAPAAARQPGYRRTPQHPLSARAGRRIPGHQPRPVPDRALPVGAAPQHLRHRRPGPEYLWLARADISNILDFERDYPTRSSCAWSRTIAPPP